MNRDLSTELARINDQHQSTAEDIHTRHAQVLEATKAITDQIAELERELNALGEQSVALSRESKVNHQVRARKVAECVSSHLDRQQDALTLWIKSAEVSEQIAALEKADPEIAQKHADCIDFEHNLDKHLESWGKTLQPMFLRSLAERKAELAPYVELLARRDDLIDSECSRMYAPVHLSEVGELTVVLPLHAADACAPGERMENSALRMSSEAATEWIHDLCKEMVWSIIEIEAGQWRDWNALRALVMTEDVSGTSDGLARGPDIVGALKVSLASRSFEINLVNVDASAWSLLNSAGERSVPPEADSDAPPENPTFAGNAWFTTEDWLGWRRASKRGRGKHWRQEGLALQSLITRMVAIGAVGNHHISLAGVSKGLPDDDAQALRSIFAQARCTGILNKHQVDGVSTYAIDPDHLDDIRDLLNGTLNETWERVLSNT